MQERRSGGYLKARPSGDKAEQDLIDRGIRPETWNLSERAKNWFFGAGGTLDPEKGKCVWTDKKLDLPAKKIQEFFAASTEGTFVPDRENDELTQALGNPEHPGQTRGTTGCVP